MWTQLKALLEKAGTRLLRNSSDLIPQHHWLLSKVLRKEVLCYQDKISQEDTEKLLEKIDNLSGRIDEFQQSPYDQDALAIEMRELRRSRLLGDIQSVVFDIKEAAGIKLPPHFLPFEFNGIDHAFAEKDYSFCLSGTNPAYLILKKKHPQQFKVGCDGFFVVGLLNCPILGSLDIIDVEGSTFAQTSIEDKEVFEAIHELRDCYETPFKLGALQTASRETFEEGDDFVVNDYGLKRRMLSYCASLENPKSLAITFVAELENLISGKNNISDIFDQIPFEELKEMGIDEFRIDLLSCKTVEIEQQIESAMLTYASMHNIKITCPIYSGYVQNNCSYCYMNTGVRNEVVEGLMAVKEGEARVDAVDVKFRNEDNKQKKDSLVEVRVPGFSIFDIIYEDELNAAIVTKNISTVATPDNSPPATDSDSVSQSSMLAEAASPPRALSRVASRVRTTSESSELGARAGSRKVEKKFIAPHAEVKKGIVFEIFLDCRERELEEVAPEAAAIDAAAAGPSLEKPSQAVRASEGAASLNPLLDAVHSRVA